MESDRSRLRLNPDQARHLLTSARYADKLLRKIEEVLFASESKSPFRYYKTTLPPGQIKIIADYLARFRIQLVRSLESQGISLPPPDIDSVYSIRTTLAFVKIAFEDCRPSRMRGYGPIPEDYVRELNGLIDEMIGAAAKLDVYLARGMEGDLQSRLQKLEERGGDVSAVKHLERIINERGLVEFRSALSMIIERLEKPCFEIALFGRVSSGKSSLLNAIVQSELLPVGVNPVTAVPTRLSFGDPAGLHVWYASRNPEHFGIDRIVDYVTEEHNPANAKHVVRIIVELPSDRLREGIVFVDTPGLGSLARSGAAETLAYLPRCDLALLLIDAGSTLTEDDLSTIQRLCEAGVSVSVLLSKSDLLSPVDRERSLAYITAEIRARLGLDLRVHPVSAQPVHAVLLDRWFGNEIFPLYERHAALAQQSLQRKIGALREEVESALRARLMQRSKKSDSDPVVLGEIDTRLRDALGRVAESRRTCSEVTGEIEEFAKRGLLIAASRIVTEWQQSKGASATDMARGALAEVAAAQARLVAGSLADLARELTGTLQDTARDLGFANNDNTADLATLPREMPTLDLGTWDISIAPGFRLKLSARMENRRVEKILREQIGERIAKAFHNFGRMLDAWSRQTLNEIEMRFDAQADKYRAHLTRLGEGGVVSEAEQVSLQHDLDELAQPAFRVTEASSGQ